MKKFRGALLFLFIYIFTCNLAVAEETLSGTIIESGKVTAFDEEHLLDENSEPVYCETSAVVYDGEKIIFGTEKPLPGKERSSIFSFPLVKGEGFDVNSRSYSTAQPFLEARKYEDFTITPDKKTILATTGFDRYSEEENLDGYNTLLAWPTGSENLVTIVDPHNRDNINSSLGLREKIRKAMISEEYPEGPAYFKVEGLAAIPNNKLLFGIREIGDNYLDYKSVIKILSVGYKGEGTSFELNGEFEEVYDSTSEVQNALGKQVALSGLEYDKFNDRLLMLTSYDEIDGNEVDADMGIGGYLWYLTIEDLEENRTPHSVYDAENKPLSFAHKPEGLTILDSTIVLVVHDDDGVLGREIIDDRKTQFSRKANEGFCDVVRLNKAIVEEELDLQEELVEVEEEINIQEDSVEPGDEPDIQEGVVEVEEEINMQEDFVESGDDQDIQEGVVEVEEEINMQEDFVESGDDPDIQEEVVEVEEEINIQEDFVESVDVLDIQEEVVEVEDQGNIQEAYLELLEEAELQEEIVEVEDEVDLQEDVVEVESDIMIQEEPIESEEEVSSEEETVDAEVEMEIEAEEESEEFNDEFVMKVVSYLGGVKSSKETAQ